MRTLLLALALGAAGCGSGTTASSDGGADQTAAFVGTWAGTTTLADGRTGAGSVVIVRTGTNALGVGGICFTGDVAATVTSATSFTLNAISCAPSVQSTGAGFCSVQVQVSGGTGTLAGSQLTLAVGETIVNIDPACSTLTDTPADFTLVGSRR